MAIALPVENRAQACRLLAGYGVRPDVLVLGLPRGGVPVAFEVAQALGAPLDVYLVRKLGVPGHRELAMGALATGGVRVLNPDLIRGLGIFAEEIEAITRAELAELRRQERVFRGDRPPPEAAGRTVILVDDGLATGSTMHAAVAALRTAAPKQVVVAVPTAPPETCAELEAEAAGWCARSPRNRSTRWAPGIATSPRPPTRRSANSCSAIRRFGARPAAGTDPRVRGATRHASPVARAAW